MAIYSIEIINADSTKNVAPVTVVVTVFASFLFCFLLDDFITLLKKKPMTFLTY